MRNVVLKTDESLQLLCTVLLTSYSKLIIEEMFPMFALSCWIVFFVCPVNNVKWVVVVKIEYKYK